MKTVAQPIPMKRLWNLNLAKCRLLVFCGTCVSNGPVDYLPSRIGGKRWREQSSRFYINSGWFVDDYSTGDNSSGTLRQVSQILANLVKQVRPNERTWLLLRVVLADDLTAAKVWHEWMAARGDAVLSPAEFRLLPSVAQRLKQLGVSSDLPNEITAARRNTFISNQARLVAVRPLLEQLCGAMPVMLLKGGARIAADPSAAHLRVIRDIDLLFKPDDLTRALEIALATGYRSINGLLPGNVKSRPLAPLFAAGEQKPNYMEVDFHAVPLRFGRLGFQETDLWQRASDAELVGLPVKVPSVSDHFLHAIAHGLVADDDSPADWILDSIIFMRDLAFDEHVVGDEIRRRRLGIPVAVAASLIEELGISVPDSILAACDRDLSNPMFRREFAATIRPRRLQTPVDGVIVNVAEWYRSIRSRRPIKSWKTSWIASPSLRRPESGWTEFTDGRAELYVRNISRDELIIRFTGVARHLKRPSFDILLEDLWIGRVRFRLIHGLAPLSPPSWKAHMTFRHPWLGKLPEGVRLTVVALDKQKAPASATLPGIRVSAQPA